MFYSLLNRGGFFFFRFAFSNHRRQGGIQQVWVYGLGNMGIHARLGGAGNILGKGVGRQGDDGNPPGVRTGQGPDCLLYTSRCV